SGRRRGSDICGKIWLYFWERRLHDRIHCLRRGHSVQNRTWTGWQYTTKDRGPLRDSFLNKHLPELVTALGDGLRVTQCQLMSSELRIAKTACLRKVFHDAQRAHDIPLCVLNLGQ